MGRLAAIVIAGGQARRFGADKLALRDDSGRTLLDIVCTGAAEYADPVIVVGPQRAVDATVIWTREVPAGGGPCAALITGLRDVPADCDQVMVLAGDSPRGALAIPRLRDALGASDHVAATLVDDQGREQPITTLYDVSALRRVTATYGSGENMSVRRILDDLRPAGVIGVPDENGAADDVDRPEDARRLGFRPGP